MNQPLFRDELGRIVGVLDKEWFSNDDEFYVDYKVDDVRFPEYKGDRNGEVTIWNLKDK